MAGHGWAALVAALGQVQAREPPATTLVSRTGSCPTVPPTLVWLPALLQVHGFPKVMGVLTHLDGFKVSCPRAATKCCLCGLTPTGMAVPELLACGPWHTDLQSTHRASSPAPQHPQDNKALKKTKKALKHRFWTEIYQGAAGVAGHGGVAELRTTHTNSSSRAALTVGAHLCWAPTPPHPMSPAGAKLFYLSGMKNGKYLKREVHNLGELRLGRRGLATVAGS